MQGSRNSHSHLKTLNLKNQKLKGASSNKLQNKSCKQLITPQNPNNIKTKSLKHQVISYTIISKKKM
jgi:hypothetical protein